MSKAPVLEKHGKSLQTLVWDDRRRPRKDTNEDTSLFLRGNNLNLIAQKCPNLRALGLSMRWGIPQSATAQPVVRIPMRYLIQYFEADYNSSRHCPGGCESYEHYISATC